MSANVVESPKSGRPAELSRVPRRLLVTMRDESRSDPRQRVYRHVGMLTWSDEDFEFAYCDQMGSDPEGRPLLGFPDLDRTYTSSEMFPLFAQRIMSARRPDRAHYLNALDLAEDSEPWEVLGRSGGRRAGDAIEVLPEPVILSDGRSSCTFLVHGVRHRGPEATEAIARLRPGDPLTMRVDVTNPVNSRAVLVQADGTELGYVPDPLVEYVNTVTGAERDHSLEVVRANGPEVGAHLRLLVRLDGRVPQGYRPF